MNLGGNVRVKKLGILTIGIVLMLCAYVLLSAHPLTNDKYVVSLKLLLVSSIKAAQVGGIEVAKVHAERLYDTRLKGKTKEGIDDPVTAADYRSHCAIYGSLMRAFPNVAVISEEATDDCNDVAIMNLRESAYELDRYNTGDDVLADARDVAVWIDPLDATKEFTENLLQYVTTMVCISVKGVPVIGVIHKPFEKVTFWAWVGHGMSLPSNIAASKQYEFPVVIVSRSHSGQVKEILKEAFDDNVQVVSAAGAGYKSLEVALENATAYVHVTAIKKWDVCAGAAIISSLGGKMTSLSSNAPLNFDSASSTVLESGLLATLKDHDWFLEKLSGARA